MHEVLIKQNLMLLRWAQKRVKKEVCRKKMTHSKCIRAEQGRWTEPSPHTRSNVNSARLGDGADVQEPRTHGHSRNAERAFDKVGVSNRSVEVSLTDPNIKTCVLTPPADGERYGVVLDDINTAHQATKKTRELRTLQVKDYNSDPGRIYTTKTHCIDKGKLLNTCEEPNNLGSEKGKLSASNEKKRLSHRKNKRDNGLLLTRDHESNRDAVLCELRSIFVDTSMSSDLHNIIMDINHDRAEYSSSSHSSSSSTSSSGHRHYSHKLYKNHSWHPGMPEDGCNGYHRPRRNKRYASVDSADEYSVLKISDVDFYYRDVDITGPTPEVRFPWQRDIAVQCELIQKNNNNDETNVNRNIVSGLGGSNGCYNANDGVGTANRNDRSRIHRSNSSEGRSADFMRAGKTGRKHVRPHSITLPEDYHLPGFSPGIPRWNSYDLNGLGLLPRQFAARHSIPEDPEDMAGTSNPLSRLDTLVHGGVPHSSSHRGSTESAPTVVLDWDDDEEEGGTEEQRKEREEREGVLPSPSVSPVPWLTDQDALAALTETLSGKQTTGLLNQANKHKGKFLTVPAYSSRSSSAATSEESDEGDETRNAHETPLPILRRGRRAAIFETQEIGDTSPYISPAEEYTDDEDE
ncbi:uncharacterized protein LOC106162515, partial [Lingula anatina]|uniref:Uncharacterized protein LOC106162515 n=1 Tax=Lingula anatina TaxID=7574 RepID=A0A1S3IAI3_LINAN